MSNDPVRHNLKVGLLAPLLKLIKVNDSNSYVDLGSDAMVVQFGYIDATIPYSNIDTVEVKSWGLIYGIGLRPGPDESLGYIATAGDAVWVALKEPQDLKAGPGSLTMNRARIALSMEDNDAFAQALEERLG